MINWNQFLWQLNNSVRLSKKYGNQHEHKDVINTENQQERN